MTKAPEVKFTCQPGWEILASTNTWPGHWGRGYSIPAAIHNCRQEASGRPTRFVLYLVPPGARMDEVTGSTITWRKVEGGPDQVFRLGEVTVR